MILAISALGPQIGKRVRPIERKGVDLVIALDTSISMDAQDVTPSRILKAKFEKANGNEPSLVEGKATVTGQGGYKSWAEVTAAMGDDRYQKDPAYQAMVQEKLANSDL